MARVSKVKLKLNLAEMFGTKVPDDSDFKAKVAQAVIDRIVERTQNGVDKGSRPLKAYSKAYAEKKGQTNVDMTLFGDMLENIDILEQTSQTVTIGFPDELQNAKAFNHTTGDTLPKRDFFGLPKKELQEIARSFLDDLKRAKEDGRTQAEDEELEGVIRGILAGDFDEDLGI